MEVRATSTGITWETVRPMNNSGGTSGCSVFPEEKPVYRPPESMIKIMSGAALRIAMPRWISWGTAGSWLAGPPLNGGNSLGDNQHLAVGDIMSHPNRCRNQSNT